MVAQVTHVQDRRFSGKVAYVVFLLFHVLFLVGLLVEHRAGDTRSEILHHQIAVIVIVLLLAAYTFAAKWISFRMTLSLTITWLVLVSSWFFNSGFMWVQDFMAVVYLLLYVVYSWLFLAGLLLKRGPTGIRDPM